MRTTSSLKCNSRDDMTSKMMKAMPVGEHQHLTSLQASSDQNNDAAQVSKNRRHVQSRRAFRRGDVTRPGSGTTSSDDDRDMGDLLIVITNTTASAQTPTISERTTRRATSDGRLAARALADSSDGCGVRVLSS